MKKGASLPQGTPLRNGASIAVTSLLALALIALSQSNKKVASVEEIKPEAILKTTSVMVPKSVVLLPPPPMQPAQKPVPKEEPKVDMKLSKATELRKEKTKTEQVTKVSKKELSEPVQAKNTTKIIRRQEAIRDGRASLKLLEHGKDEMVNLVWPDDMGERAKLYRVLKNRLGMQSVLIDEEFRIYTEVTPPGMGAQLNRDRFSTIIRAPEGVLPNEEEIVVERLSRRHQNARGSLQHVRIFPRDSDAMLLGAIQALRSSSNSLETNNDIRISIDGRSLRLSDYSENEIRISF